MILAVAYFSLKNILTTTYTYCIEFVICQDIPQKRNKMGVIMESPLTKEFHYYLEHQPELIKKYDGKFIVIKNNEIIGVYDGQSDAVKQTIKNHKIGSFLVQKVEPGEGAYTQTFHSRVAFR